MTDDELKKWRGSPGNGLSHLVEDVFQQKAACGQVTPRGDRACKPGEMPTCARCLKIFEARHP